MRFVLALTCLTMLLAVPASAQTDPYTDACGVYFDQGATVNCATAPVGMIDAYVVLTHLTSVGIRAWEMKLEVLGGGVLGNMAFSGLAINATTPPEYSVGLGEAIYGNPIVVATMSVYVSSVEMPVEFMISGIRFSSVDPRAPNYVDSEDIGIIKVLRQSTGGPDVPVATINGDCVVGAENETWSGVKSLFR
ncbi:MAG: hypothetical protein R6X25_07750 [Candidatus Krumholzibacteriia bacterium]